MKLYLREMARWIDAKAEVRRGQEVKFASADSAPKKGATAEEQVVRQRKPHPTTIPNDSDAIADLTEGERRIAEKNPRAAESSFQRVLAKYPDQPRAWYGM